MKKIEEMAGSLYEAYCTAVGGKAFNGDPLPDWKTFRADPAKQKQSNAWIAVAAKSVGLLAADIATLGEEALQLCYAIEAIPASTEQTNASIKASAFSSKLRELSVCANPVTGSIMSAIDGIASGKFEFAPH